jgi:hypothetical protein
MVIRDMTMTFFVVGIIQISMGVSIERNYFKIWLIVFGN